MSGRRYSKEEKVEAIALALSIGPKKAAEQTGINRATIALWRKDPEFQDVVARHEEELSARFLRMLDKSLQRIEEGLDNPKARLLDVVKAAEALHKSYILVTGGATERSESKQLNVTVPAEPRLEPGEQKLLDEYIDWARKQEDPRRVG